MSIKIQSGCCGATTTYSVDPTITPYELAKLTGMSLEKAVALVATFVEITCEDGYTCETCGCIVDCDQFDITFESNTITIDYI